MSTKHAAASPSPLPLASVAASPCGCVAPIGGPRPDSAVPLGARGELGYHLLAGAASELPGDASASSSPPTARAAIASPGSPSTGSADLLRQRHQRRRASTRPASFATAAASRSMSTPTAARSTSRRCRAARPTASTSCPRPIRFYLDRASTARRRRSTSPAPRPAGSTRPSSIRSPSRRPSFALQPGDAASARRTRPRRQPRRHVRSAAPVASCAVRDATRAEVAAAPLDSTGRHRLRRRRSPARGRARRRTLAAARVCAAVARAGGAARARGRLRVLTTVGNRALVATESLEQPRIVAVTTKLLIADPIALREPLQLAIAAPEDRLLVASRCAIAARVLGSGACDARCFASTCR